MLSRRLVILAVLALTTLVLWPRAVSAFDEDLGPDAPLDMEALLKLPLDLSMESPQLLSPLDGTTTTGTTDPPVGVPTLRWSSVPEATRYLVEVSSSAGFADPVVQQVTYALSYTPIIALADGPYYWRVKGGTNTNWGPDSATRSFTKDWSDSGTLVPQLLHPTSGEELTAFGHDDFSWSPVTGAARYLLEIGSDPSFSSTVYTGLTLAPFHTPTERLANSVYFWRVTPIDRQGHFGASSVPSPFTFNWSVAPQLLGPDHNVDVKFTPRFSWTAVEATRRYLLQISTEPDFGDSLAFTVSNTDYTPLEALSNDQDYYWRVQAQDYRAHNSPWSEVRRFRTDWDFQAQLLTPQNNAIRLSYPFLSWTPIPGAERYHVQIDESNSFAPPLIADEKLYNVTTYAHPRWQTVQLDKDYFWRVRGIDAKGNVTPWSAVRSFRPSSETSPNPVYPFYYYTPDTTTAPVYSDRRVAWPVFVWDTVHGGGGGISYPPDYYVLTVDDNSAFMSPNFILRTKGLAAAPTQAHPFIDLQEDTRYYWRVQAFRDEVQMGADVVWVMHYHSEAGQLEPSSTITPIYPPAGFEAVDVPPVLGWQPVTGAGHYHLQISRNRDFSDVVDEAYPQFVNYVPWQGREEDMPFGTYWWRVRTQNPVGDWSEPRHFNLSIDVIAGNPNDFDPAGNILDDDLAYVDTDPADGLGAYELGLLHCMLDRTITQNYNWVIAFESGAGTSDNLWYGIYIDTDHVEESGAPRPDPMERSVPFDPLYAPDYVLYFKRSTGDVFDPSDAYFFTWNHYEGLWDPPRTLENTGGEVQHLAAHGGVQVLLPYTAIGSADPDSVGSVAFTVFTTSDSVGDTMHDAVPEQNGLIDNPAFVSDMLMPLYPFDTPLFNPFVFQDVPPMRWRMPYFDSVDGYQVELARDSRFTDVVQTWETYESSTSPYFALMPTTYQPKDALPDNESYYWRVRIRHERYTNDYQMYDYGPWSPAMRFSLDSHIPSNLAISTDTLAQQTPTFSWDRIENASGYTIQIDDDSNFSSPVLDIKTAATSFTPDESWAFYGLGNGTYYWRVAMRRSSTVRGRWVNGPAFEKRLPSPAPVGPINDEVVHRQPTLMWDSVLLPVGTPRMAAPRYRVILDDDPNLSNPKYYVTESTSFTLPDGHSIEDGTWYWRVAMLDANDVLGPYSDVQRFYKEYLPPTLIAPVQGSATGDTPSFEWSPLDGAAYYTIQFADNELFNFATSATTDNTRFTPTTVVKEGSLFWRVRMIDDDYKPGPLQVGRVTIGRQVFVPLITR